jgi:hypothetical protein
MEIDFEQIVPRLGGKREAFEELCCQLAHYTLPKDAYYIRLYGAGGDGGVECFGELPDGNRIGWQAKFVFDINSLLKQVTESLVTALNIHSKLSRYIICFPFDLTGPTRRRGLSGQEKLDNWRRRQEQEALERDRQLTIEAWPAFKLRQLLLEHDASGGIREYFFHQEILTNEWFSEHIDLVIKTAGPRYTPELNVKTDLWKWFAAFGHASAWSDEFTMQINACRKAHDHLASAVGRSHPDSSSPKWPEDSLEEVKLLADDILAGLNKCDRLITLDERGVYRDCVRQLDDLLTHLESLEAKLVEELEAKHGKGKADSPGFRQFMAEYMVSFPAANLDYTRDMISALRNLVEWLNSPAGSLAYERVFVLSGVAGSGKTHGVCDTADRRFSDGLLTCVIFGHEFRGEPDPWTRILETFGLPVTLGKNGLLDVLNAAGEASGSPLMLCIDAINETRPLRYWRDRISAVSQAVQRRPFLRLCITCRTSFLPFCLPDNNDLPIVEHTGFTGIERDACQAFFHYYDLEPPIAPILQPELSNPLYLRLVCGTLRSRGLRRLPLGWHGIAPTIREFLKEKERQFAAEYETSPGASMVSGCLVAISRAIAESGDSAITWSEAQRVISAARPQARILQVLEWLVHADLLLEDAPLAANRMDEESIVRPAFERLGDFLVASEILERCEQIGLDVACQPGGVLHALWMDSDVLEQNSGVLAALTVLVPEKAPGFELPNFVDNRSIYNSLLRIAIRSFPSRDPATFSETTASLIREALELTGFSFDAMDAVLTLSWIPSIIDAIWIDGLLKQKPLADRDAYWCGYLHDRYESNGTVRHLIDAAFELPLVQLDFEVAERWSTILLWFTAAADRRVKDWATRAATDILIARPKAIPIVLGRLIFCDDDEVRERALLSCYGALIVSRDIKVIRLITTMLQQAFRQEPQSFGNALIRDDIRCISELAREVDSLPKDCDPELTMQPIVSEWPLELPTENEVEEWGKLLHFYPSEFLSDFFKYSMNCLRPWEHSFPKKNMGEWILQRAARDFRYEGSGCEKYDNYMLGKHGGGRGKPTWAERIGKKYQWLGMYQLASRLHDQIERKGYRWEPEPLRTPLILLEERKLDPTLPSKITGGERNADAWWIKANVDLRSTEALSDQEWVSQRGDIPPLDGLLSVVEYGGQNWRLLVSYPTWGQGAEDAGFFEPYRQVWMHIESYLVRRQEFTGAYKSLLRRNFFGQWMPQGNSWLYGFAGEYPWATPFNTDPEERDHWGEKGIDLRAVFDPCWNCRGVAV